MSDFDTPEHAARREHCKRFGHRTMNELEVTQSTHGTRLVCLHCGKFWHGEPEPPELPVDKPEGR